TMPVCPEPLNTETMAVRREVSTLRLQNQSELVQISFYRVPPAKSFKNSCGLPILSVWLSLDGWRARDFARQTLRWRARASAQHKYLHYSRGAVRLGWVPPTIAAPREAALHPARLAGRPEFAVDSRARSHLEAPREFGASTPRPYPRIEPPARPKSGASRFDESATCSAPRRPSSAESEHRARTDFDTRRGNGAIRLVRDERRRCVEVKARPRTWAGRASLKSAESEHRARARTRSHCAKMARSGSFGMSGAAAWR
ncbi:hypothetical protein B0H15DRAFT_841778, partial [Mycena belliarum]